MKILTFKEFSSNQNKTYNFNEVPFVIIPKLHEDNRGAFWEEFKCDEKSTIFKDMSWCKQINMSSSEANVFRGFHMQTDEYSQGKLIQCVHGTIFDFAVDCRKDSPTRGKMICIQLDDCEHRQFWIPRGFLHGFFVTSDEGATIQYKCDNVYNKESEITVSPQSVFVTICNNLPVIFADNASDDEVEAVNTLVESFVYDFEDNEVVMSEKDAGGIDLNDFLDE